MHHFILLPPRSVQLLRRVARVTAAWQQTFLAWAGPLPAQTRRTCKMFANCTFAASSVVTSLWIIVTEWDLELGFHRSNTVHQFFCKPVVDTFWKMPSACDCIAPLLAAAVSPCLRCSPVMVMAIYPARQILTVPHLAGGRDHAHTGTVSLHSLGVFKLLSNLFDDCNFLIWKGRWYRTCEKLAVLKLKFRPPARCQ